MPELPDITAYIEALQERVLNEPIVSLRLNSPFLLRTAVPPIQSLVGQTIQSVSRMGKRIVFHCPNDFSLVLHLMIAGRLHWYKPRAKVPVKSALLQLEFPTGTLTLTEAGSKKRASLHYLSGPKALLEIAPQGLEVLTASQQEFRERLTQKNHTLKRALTSPRIFSGIGNAYSDEILHRARLSPTTQTQKMGEAAITTLYDATQSVLVHWINELRLSRAGGFPKKVTAFRDGMAVHGRYQKPCPVCGTAIQRIRYVGNETNYCPRCQTSGKLLADRAMSRLLKQDWPKTIEELEQGKA